MEGDKVYDSEETVKKTGSKKKTAIISAIGAAVGAFVGDIFAVRDHEIVSQVVIGQYPDGTDITNTYIKEYSDTGGLFDLMHKTQDGYAPGGDDGDISKYIAGIEREGATYVNNIVDYHGEATIAGAALGGGVGFGADYIKKRREATKEEARKIEDKKRQEEREKSPFGS